MTLSEACEILDYLNQHPTAAEILAAVYEVKSKPSKRPSSPKEMKDESYTELSSLPMYGMVPEGLPEDFKESIKYFNEVMSKKKAN